MKKIFEPLRSLGRLVVSGVTGEGFGILVSKMKLMQDNAFWLSFVKLTYGRREKGEDFFFRFGMHFSLARLFGILSSRLKSFALYFSSICNKICWIKQNNAQVAIDDVLSGNLCSWIVVYQERKESWKLFVTHPLEFLFLRRLYKYLQ